MYSPTSPIPFPRPAILIATSILLFLIYQLSTPSGATVFPRWSSPSLLRPKLHLLLPVNEGADRTLFCKTLMSAHVHGYEPVVINWDVKGERDEHLKAKITGVNNFLTSLPPSAAQDGDLVLMIDSLDCWLQLPASIMIDRFLSLGVSMVVGAEKRCWPAPNNDEDHSEVCTGAPESPLPKGTFPVNAEDPTAQFHLRPRWANSGSVMGSVEAMIPIYAHMVKHLDDPEQLNDQGYFNQLLHDGHLTLDYWHRLFYSNFGSAKGDSAFVNVPSPEYLSLSPISASSSFSSLPSTYKRARAVETNYPQSEDLDIIPFHLLPTLFLHTLTASFPAVIHFNEPWNKHLLDEYWGKLWWTRAERRWREPVIKMLDGGGGGLPQRGRGRATRFAHDGSRRGFWEVCPASALNMTIDEDWWGL